MATITKNEEIFSELATVIPGGVNSPARAWKGLSDYPLVAERGQGACVWDVDGAEYIDYCQSWGALLRGHAHPDICRAATETLQKGSSFGMATALEGELAARICQLVPSIEKIRFVSSGTEATMSAARLARGFTGRPLILKFTGHYHGHADFFLVQAGSGVAGLTPTSSSAGIPAEVVQHTICLPFNDIQACRKFFEERGAEVAAVILEPIAANMGVVPPVKGFLRELRALTHQHGSLLIFDEVITGFRVGADGAQGLYGIQPDLSCFGKIVGGGFPAAAFGGRAEIMDHLAPLGTVYQAGTLSGNPVAMAAGLANLALVDQAGFYEGLEAKTNVITEAVTRVIEERNLRACMQQVGSLFTLFFGVTQVQSFEDTQALDADCFRAYFHHMLSRGILVSPSAFEACFVSAAHTTEHVEKTRDAIIDFLSDSM